VGELPELAPDGVYRNLVFDETRHAHAELDGARFEGCSLARVDLRNARLNGAVFRDCNLSGARIARANLFGVTFERCKLMGVDFHDGLTLTAATFTGCNLDFSIFRGVVLDKMTFRDCTFVEADLSMTSLRLATFADCDLSGVDLRETVFFQTDVRGSMLGGWNLKRDELAGIVVSPGQAWELLGEIGVLVIE
jgi:fluoroquinolone resistance protein